MFKYTEIDPVHFKEFLWQGLFDDRMEEVLNNFFQYVPEIQFNLVLYIKEHLRDLLPPKVLAKALKISKADGERIIKGPHRIFPIVLTAGRKEWGIISQGLVIPETSKIITNLLEIRKYLRVVKEFVGKPFAVFFKDYFSGASFMLPLAVALTAKEIPQDLIFTGKIDKQGRLFEVEDLSLKRKISESLGYRLVTPLQVRDFSVIHNFLERSTWDIPFYVTSSGSEEFENFLRFYQGIKEIEGMPLLEGFHVFYGLERENFCLFTGQLKEEEDWKKVVKDFYHKINYIKNRLPGQKVFHLAMRGPVSLAFALGVLFSHFDPFVFYHYQTLEGTLSYHPIEIMTPRILKERLEEFKLIRAHFECAEEDLVVILNFSHHEPLADVKKFVKERIPKASFLVLETEYKGNLPIDKFVEVAKESASYIQKVRESFSFERYHFFFSCPVAIGFMVGLAFGHYVDGWIYNFEKGEALYKPVLDFKVLRKLREESQI